MTNEWRKNDHTFLDYLFLRYRVFELRHFLSILRHGRGLELGAKPVAGDAYVAHFMLFGNGRGFKLEEANIVFVNLKL
jgi:hypothetical protein